MIRFIKREPAMLVAILIAAANLVGFSVTGEGETALLQVIESLVILLGGGVVRSRVSPISK